MYILGVTCFGQHDSGVSLVKDGELVFSSEEERYTRVRHDNGFPSSAIAACLETMDICIEDIDAVAFYSDLSNIPYNAVKHLLKYFPRSLKFALKAKNFMEHHSFPEAIRKNNGYTGEIFYVRHHLSHGAGAFLSSPFDEGAILTIDGTGEWTTTWMGKGCGTSIEELGNVRFPHSLGKLYETVTQFLGFRPNHGEGKVMGLAAYGKPVYKRIFREILKLDDNNGFTLNMNWFRFHLGDDIRYSRKFIKAFGNPRKPGESLSERDADLAASLQEAIEEAGVHLARQLRKITGSTNLTMAGGVALNGRMNQRIIEEAGFENVFIFPAANDPGTSAGAALYTYFSKHENGQRHLLRNAYLGDEFTSGEIEEVLKSYNLPFSIPKDPPAECARLLETGKILGWFQGRMEFGPRALGNRSILADPRRGEMKDIINMKVKRRESFRPFAPVVLEDACGEYFESSTPSPYMLRVYKVKEKKKSVIPAVTHVDGTGRVQTINREQNILYYDLIKEFRKLTGVPVLLNTSLNIKGEPIVRSPSDALDAFIESGMDALMLGPFLVKKVSD